MRLPSLLACLVFAAPFAVAGDGVREAEAPLTRPETPPFAEAQGVCDIRDGADFQRFRVTVRGVGADAPLALFMGDGLERLVRIGEIPPGAAPRTFLRTTLEHGELPFGTDHVGELAGRRIVIFDGEERVVLRGEVPAFREEPPPPPPVEEPVTERNYMHRTEAAGERESRGIIVAVRREESSALVIEVGRLAPETGYIARIGGEDESAVVGDFRTNREGGAAIVRDTAKGQTLPLGADGVSALAGRRVTVETLEGAVVLYGEVPTFEHMDTESEVVREHDRFVDDETGAVVRVDVVVNEETGRERLRVECRDIPRESFGDEPRDTETAGKAGRRGAAEIWLADAADTLRLVDTVRIRRGRRAVWSYLAHRGDELPFGAASLREFAGRSFEIRVRGAVVAAGTLPQF